MDDGLRQTDDGVWQMWFNGEPICNYDVGWVWTSPTTCTLQMNYVDPLPRGERDALTGFLLARDEDVVEAER